MVAARDLLRQAHDSAERGDDPGMDTVAHTLASGTAMLGAGRLAAVCRELQRAAEAGDRPAARAALVRADREFESFTAHAEETLMRRAA